MIFVLHILKNTLVARNRIFLNESLLKVTYRVSQGPDSELITIQWISIREANYIINWIVINPVDGVIRLLNNWTYSSGSGLSDKRGDGYPDPEIRGRGGRSPKKIFSAHRASVWYKNKEWPGPPGPFPRSATGLYPPFLLTLIWKKPEDNPIRPVPIVLVKCWKVAHWNAKKLLKNCQKSKKWLPKFQKLMPKFLAIFI